MRCGTIKCKCGQVFYFETVNNSISCISCKGPYDITDCPEKLETLEEPIEEVGEEDGTDI